MTAPLPEPPHARPRAAVIGLLVAAAVGAFVLNGFRVVYPVMQGDDFQIVSQSWTWAKTWDGLWVPQNEHAMPLGRVLTRLLILLAGRPTALPLATALVGPCALVLGLPLVYLFVRRELGHPFYAVLAVVLFGVTAVYQQAVYWFAAAYSVFALDTMLLALLAVQRYRCTNNPWHLGLCGLLCALAPGWFASGVLVGPFCCLYLLPAEHGTVFPTVGARLRSWLVPLTPLLGTVAFLALSLPHNARTIIHLEHYEMQNTNAVQAFRPDKGVYYTGKALVENLLLGLVGVWEIPVPWWLVMFVLLPLLFAAGTWWWSRARPQDRRLMLLGVGLIVASYVLVYSARSRWADQFEMCGAAWCRYNLVPQLGLALFFCGGLPAREGRRFQLNADGSLTRRQVVGLSSLIVLFFLIQATRGVAGAYMMFPGQEGDLHRVEVVDACCREQRIGADAARRALPKFDIEGSFGSINGWDFLWGSDTPVERPDEDLKKILEKCE